MDFPIPTIEELAAARREFERREPRDLFYRAATELVELAIRGEASLNVGEALAVLLLTWSASYYRFRGFTEEHISQIERLVADAREEIAVLRARSLEDYAATDEARVAALFERFEQVLGPVGAAKALHLLAPRFFPLWDRAIADGYRLGLGPQGSNGRRYCAFMALVRRQCERLRDAYAGDRSLLKALDEYNYCRYTKGSP